MPTYLQILLALGPAVFVGLAQWLHYRQLGELMALFERRSAEILTWTADLRVRNAQRR